MEMRKCRVGCEGKGGQVVIKEEQHEIDGETMK